MTDNYRELREFLDRDEEQVGESPARDTVRRLLAELDDMLGAEAGLVDDRDDWAERAMSAEAERDALAAQIAAARTAWWSATEQGDKGLVYTDRIEEAMDEIWDAIGHADWSPETVREHDAKVWDEGYRSGHSRAMRLMSDEPNVPAAENPYRKADDAAE